MEQEVVGALQRLSVLADSCPSARYGDLQKSATPSPVRTPILPRADPEQLASPGM